LEVSWAGGCVEGEAGTEDFVVVGMGRAAVCVTGAAVWGTQPTTSSRTDSREGRKKELVFIVIFMENRNQIQYITRTFRLHPAHGKIRGGRKQDM
jgi:hypothetical protein